STNLTRFRNKIIFNSVARDITERRQAEDAIRNKNAELESLNEELNAALEEMESTNEEIAATNEELNRKERDLLNEKIFTEALFESIPGFLYVYDDEGKLIRWNKKFETMTGCSGEELSRMRMEDLFAGGDSKRMAVFAENVFNNGYGEIEGELYTKGGGRLCIHLSGVRLIMGDKLYFTGVGIDITERVRAEEKLRESGQEFENMVHDMHVGVLLQGPHAEILMCNPKAIEYLGLSENQLLGKTSFDLDWNVIHEDGSPFPGESHPVPQAIATRQSVRKVVMGVHRPATGDRIWLLVDAEPQFNRDGSIRRIVCTFNDITELKRAEEALRESESRFRNLLQDVQTVAVQGYGPDGTIRYWNHASEILYGYSADEAIGKNLLDLIVPSEMRDIVRHAMYDMAESGKPIPSSEVSLMRKDGSRVVVYSSRTIVQIPGRAQELFCIDIDLTEQKQAEANVRKLLEEKDVLLKEVHHRIKNNMGTIKSLLSLQARNMHDSSAATALRDAESRVQGMMVLYDKLYGSANFQQIPVAEYLSSLVDEIVANFPNSRIVRIEKLIDDFVMSASELQPFGIIINELLTNIMKYAFTGRTEGVIGISVRLQGNRVTLVLRDDGNGLPENVDFTKSTGFGLMLVGMLVKQLEGEIKIERGHGTMIIVEFEK
ncbi:MAG TPA: PAS domain S-box protein, partial [Spirochaetota bacterium]